MSQFTAEDLRAAAARMTDDLAFPLTSDLATAFVLNDVIAPALEDLPAHLNCEVVRHALQTLFVMGLDCGIQLERGR